MASSTALKAAILVEVAKIGDTLLKAEATYLVDQYIDALDAINKIEAGGLQSYSIAGRSFTHADSGGLRSSVDKMRSRIYEMIYGSESLMDLNTEVAQPYSQEIT